MYSGTPEMMKNNVPKSNKFQNLPVLFHTNKPVTIRAPILFFSIDKYRNQTNLTQQIGGWTKRILD